MEAIGHLLLSIVATAMIAGIVTVIGNEAFNQHFNYLSMWLVCFCAWWGIFLIGEC